MNFGAGIAVGVVIGIAITLFTSLLTELIVVVALGAVVIYVGRKKWSKKESTPSTEKISPLP